MANQNVKNSLAVAGIVIAVLVIMQPLSGAIGGVSLNWIGVGLVAVGGLLPLAS
jgi:hypothetical protein